MSIEFEEHDPDAVQPDLTVYQKTELCIELQELIQRRCNPTDAVDVFGTLMGNIIFSVLPPNSAAHYMMAKAESIALILTEAHAMPTDHPEIVESRMMGEEIQATRKGNAS